jgi:hypothetical protein
MNVDDYAGRDGLHACFNDCMRLAGERALDDLMVALTVKAVRTYEKHEVPRIAAAALISSGEEGVRRLQDFIHAGEIGGLRASAALRALWLAGKGKTPMESSLGLSYPEVPVEAAAREQARIAIDDFIAAAPKSAARFSLLVDFQHEETRVQTWRYRPSPPTFSTCYGNHQSFSRSPSSRSSRLWWTRRCPKLTTKHSLKRTPCSWTLWQLRS